MRKTNFLTKFNMVFKNSDFDDFDAHFKKVLAVLKNAPKKFNSKFEWEV